MFPGLGYILCVRVMYRLVYGYEFAGSSIPFNVAETERPLQQEKTSEDGKTGRKKYAVTEKILLPNFPSIWVSVDWFLGLLLSFRSV